jgi:2'-5' RNA ligase
MVKKETLVRTFLAVAVPQPIRMHVWRIAENERQKDVAVKWVGLDNIHITLKFLGEIDEKQQADISRSMQQIAAQHESFVVNLKGIGCFPNPKYPRVLWVGVDKGSDELCTLAREIDEQLVVFDFRPEKRFHPHVTIARMRKPCVIDHILNQSIATDTLTQQGAIYEPLERYAFSGVKSQHST